MKGRIVAAAAIVAALFVAATVRPPRAVAPLRETFSALATPLPSRRTVRAHHARTRKPRLAHHSKRARTKPRPVAALDVNTAGAEQLATIPGIDRRLAARIVAVRALGGPFESIEELSDVDGISQRKLDRIASYLKLR
jgi:competence ComEA-like helix-hairpin-helix protein